MVSTKNSCNSGSLVNGFHNTQSFRNEAQYRSRAVAKTSHSTTCVVSWVYLEYEFLLKYSTIHVYRKEWIEVGIGRNIVQQRYPI